jgi:hypothetical protein
LKVRTTCRERIGVHIILDKNSHDCISV